MNESAAPPQESLKDPVTQLYAHRHLLRRLQENMARCDRSKEKMAVLLWDIDGFSEYNNHFGQEKGDELLLKVAVSIRQCVRVYDEAFRSGPDEFCAILMPADEKLAVDVAERVKRIISKSLFEKGMIYEGHDFSLVSGMVFYPSDDRVADALLHAARQALFASKKIRGNDERH